MLRTLEETVSLIEEGRILHIAADESLLCRLPKGKWIGGTTPYFISEEGGIFTKERLFVNFALVCWETNVCPDFLRCFFCIIVYYMIGK